jgi:hypothetical protein
VGARKGGKGGGEGCGHVCEQAGYGVWRPCTGVTGRGMISDGC